ncbi:diguanylate cyclase (GGDEF)-like protein [Vogesella perlucida]|jgi:diguanylate cyclase (GGDEF)-like protein|nr:diguanylate cyclase (GGDEF)-like protein [Vogesella perlucida]
MTRTDLSHLSSAGPVTADASRLQQILDLLPHPVMLFRPDHTVEYANAEARRLYGEPQHAPCHQYIHGIGQPCDSGTPCPRQQVLERRQPITVEQACTDSFGQQRYYEITLAPLFTAHGELDALLETHHDVTARRLEAQRLQLLQGHLTELAHRDSLTGLANRRYLELKLDTLAKDNTARLCALLFLDLDRFKAINDVHGHVIGDRVLSTMAARLRGVVRTSDLLIRVGGDEFAVLLENTNESGARAVASKIIAALGVEVEGLSQPNSVSASVGITLFHSGSVMPRDILNQADSAMYRAKRRGGNDRELVRL